MDDSTLPDAPVLTRDFYARPVLRVARECIGKLLISRIDGHLVVARIVGTEAYRGPDDRAAHSFRSRRTARTEVMFGEAGHASFLLCMEFILLSTSSPAGRANRRQFSSAQSNPLLGLEHIVARRNAPLGGLASTNGPGTLCAALGSGRRHNGLDLTVGELTLPAAPDARAVRSPRIGIDCAGTWALKPWRFHEPDNPHVSRAPNAQRRPQ